MKKNSKLQQFFFTLLPGVGLFLISFFLRWSAYRVDRPLWTDEYSSWTQASLVIKYGLGVFTQTNSYFETNNIISHFFFALFRQLAGQTVSAALIPVFLVGVTLPVIMYYLGKKHLGNTEAFLAGLLIAFSYMEITWSLQLRGYIFQQFLVLVSTYCYLSFYKNWRLSRLLILLCLFVISVLTHLLLGVFFFSLLLHWLTYSLLQKENRKTKNVKRILLAGTSISAVALVFLFYSGILPAVWKAVLSGALSLHNNFWFYHSFFWRQYSWQVLLAGIGFSLGLIKKHPFFQIATLFIFLYLFVIVFILSPYVTRYTLVIFPFIYAGIAFYIPRLMKNTFRLSSQKVTVSISVFFVLLLILQGNNFIRKPEHYYSVNYDGRQIAIIDYNIVYTAILEKIHIVEIENSSVAIIDTWWDRTRFYLGEEYPHLYGFRWENTGKFTNGLPQSTTFLENQNREKTLPLSGIPPVRLITNLSDLHLAMSKHPYGFIFIDDSTLPQDVQNYAKENMHHELYIDSYAPELLENPYSRWPANLYSWGFESPNPFYDSSGSGELSPVVDPEMK